MGKTCRKCEAARAPLILQLYRAIPPQEEALRRIKPDVNPEQYAAFVASALEGQDTETVMRLYGISSDNLYQIRKRLTAKLRETVASVLVEMDAPGAPGLRT